MTQTIFDKKQLCDLLDKTQLPKDKSESVTYYQEFKDDIITNIITKVAPYTEVYGATLTFNRKWHKETAQDLHHIVITKLDKNRSLKKMSYYMRPEFTTKGLLHYHLIAYDTYQIHLANFARFWRRKFGFVKLELQLTNKNAWTEYIMKSYGLVGLHSISNIKTLPIQKHKDSLKKEEEEYGIIKNSFTLV